MELLKAAWNGWYSFSAGGRLAALFLIALSVLWIYYNRVTQKPFLIYTTAAAICCVFPLTAAGLMKYQTGFYGYEWIWSLVPMTALTGYAAVMFCTEILREATGGRRGKNAVALAGLLVMTLLCGGMGASPWDSTREQEERKTAEALILQLREQMGDREIMMWAPQEILEYVREYDAGIRLLYGRNMWEEYLNAYVYGGYSREVQRLYAWMEGRSVPGAPPSGWECASILRNTEVNCILLPGDTEEETVGYFEEILGVSRRKLENYYLLVR